MMCSAVEGGLGFASSSTSPLTEDAEEEVVELLRLVIIWRSQPTVEAHLTCGEGAQGVSLLISGWGNERGGGGQRRLCV